MSFRSALLTVATLFVAACGAPPKFAQDVQPILTQSCAVGSSCHGAPAGAGARLHLSEGAAYANIVGVNSFELMTMPLVDPGHPERSFLLHKVRDTMYTLPACNAATRNCGEKMPMVGGVMLTPAQIAT